MSVALPALRLSLAIGGLVALVHLPFAIHNGGAIVFGGFFAALILVALPAYMAELTFLRLHHEPLLIAVFEQMKNRRFRWGWAIAGILTIITGLCLAALAHYSAGVIIQALPAWNVEAIPDAGANRDYHWQHPLVLLYWMLFALMMLRSAGPQPDALQWLSRLGSVVIGLLFVAIVIPGLLHFADMDPFPVSRDPWRAGMHGFSMGVLASLAGLGVVYTTLYNHSRARPYEAERAAPVFLGLSFVGLVAWVLALLGWASFFNDGNAPDLRGIDFLLGVAVQMELPPPFTIAVLLMAVLVLLQSAVYLSSVTLSWLQARMGERSVWPCLLLVVVALAITRALDIFMLQVATGQLSSDVLAFLPWLGPALIPLAALVMLSLFTRALPPGPMLWAQGRSLPVAAALYVHWRYPVRLALLVSFLHTSGIGAELIAFWQPPEYEQQVDSG